MGYGEGNAFAHNFGLIARKPTYLQLQSMVCKFKFVCDSQNLKKNKLGLSLANSAQISTGTCFSSFKFN